MSLSQEPSEKSLMQSRTSWIQTDSFMRPKQKVTNLARAMGLIHGSQSIRPFSYQGTVLELLLSDVKLYFFIAWMIFWLILRHMGVIEPVLLPEIAARYIGYSQAVLSFLLVFFLNATYTEFKEQGRAAVCGCSPSSTAIILSKVFFKDAPHLQERMIRLINAAHYLSWMDLCKYYSWRELLERGLLTEEEIAALKANRASKKYRMPMVWALEEVAAYAVRKQEALDDWLTTPQEKHIGSKPHVVNEYLMTRIIDLINEGRSRFNVQFICRGVQVPTLYTHMVFWLMTIVLLVLGMYAGIGTEDAVTETSNQAWWIGGYLMVVLSYLSVFDVAIALREPFGRDAGLDIDPLVYVESTMKNHLAVHELPAMLESEQTCKPAFDMFASLRRANPEEGGGGDFKPPARGPSYVSTYK